MKQYAVARYENNFEFDTSWFDEDDLERAEQYAIEQARYYNEEFHIYKVEPVLVGRTKSDVVVEKINGDSSTDYSW